MKFQFLFIYFKVVCWFLIYVTALYVSNWNFISPACFLIYFLGNKNQLTSLSIHKLMISLKNLIIYSKTFWKSFQVGTVLVCKIFEAGLHRISITSSLKKTPFSKTSTRKFRHLKFPPKINSQFFLIFTSIRLIE